MDIMAENESSSIISICDQLKMFKIDKSDREGDPHSLVYKIFRTKLSPDSFESSLLHDSQRDLDDILGKSDPLSSSSFLSEDKALLLAFDQAISPGDLIPEDFSHEEMLHSPPVKTKPYIVSVQSEEKRELRRSSRLQAKSNFSLDSVKIEEDESTISTSPREKRKSKLCKRKRKSRKKSAPLTAGIKREIEDIFDNSENPQFCNPKRMKLKHMVVRERAKNLNYMGCPYYKISGNMHPKFANVDPSVVLSTVNIHSDAPEFSPKKRQVALFTTRNKNMNDSTSWNNENYHCCFKKMQMDIPYLRKRYQMLDSVTLDYYYAMSGYSLRNTEIILQDIIFGKEVIYSKLQYFPPSHRIFFAPVSNHKVKFSNSAEPYPSQNLVGSSERRSNKLFRKILVEALKVLYCEEAGSTEK